MSQSDALPKWICTDCWQKTEQFHEFHRAVQQAQNNYLAAIVKCEFTFDPLDGLDAVQLGQQEPDEDATEKSDIIEQTIEDDILTYVEKHQNDCGVDAEGERFNEVDAPGKIRVSSQQKRYECDICGRKYSRLKQLAEHMDEHSKEKLEHKTGTHSNQNSIRNSPNL